MPMNKQRVDKVLRQMRITMAVLPTTRRRALYERLRQKIGSDIRDIMRESGIHYDTLAAMMKTNKAEVKEMIWTRDLKLSELVRLLSKLDAECYPLIRTRKK